MSSSLQVRARKLDIAARGVDLLTALTNVAASSSSLVGVALEIGQWLGREGLAKHELEECMRRARGLATANDKGQALFAEILEGVESKPVGPLFLRQSGSLGLLMAKDPRLSWMISTIACLFQFHRDDRYVTQTLASFIFRFDGVQNARGYQEYNDKSLFHIPGFPQIVHVIRKIVSSVWHNVINAGCDVLPLPSELTSLCAEGHYLADQDLSCVMHVLSFQCTSRAILKTDHLIHDLMIWLFLHYDGRLVVTLRREVIYEEELGKADRELEVNINYNCAGGHRWKSDEGYGKEKWKIMRNIEGKFEDFLSGQSSCGVELSRQPGVRQHLYQIPKRQRMHSSWYDYHIERMTRYTAQKLMKWLLKLSVSPVAQHPPRSSRVLVFAVQSFSCVDIDRAHSCCKISELLQRIPTIIHLKWDMIEPPLESFEDHREEKEPVFSSSRDEQYYQSGIKRLIRILHFFPSLTGLLQILQRRCECTFCKSASTRYQNRHLKTGCLQREALEDVMLLLAHSIADGFGVDDVSAVSDRDPIIDCMGVILHEFCFYRRVTWNSWFRVAASVYLGCPDIEEPGGSGDEIQGSRPTLAAIQYGNIAAIAPWLDLTKELLVEGCFGLVRARGRVGIIAANQDPTASDFNGVAGNFAIIATVQTEHHFGSSDSMQEGIVPNGSSLRLREDETGVATDSILTTLDETFYELFLRVKTSRFWRMVDPSDAMEGAIRRSALKSCSHTPRGTLKTSSPIKNFSFGELLGTWPDVRNKEHEGEIVCCFSSILDTHLKRNIALALTVELEKVVENDICSCCVTCAMHRVRDRGSDRGDNTRNRYIINIDSSALKARKSRSTEQKLVTQSKDEQDENRSN